MMSRFLLKLGEKIKLSYQRKSFHVTYSCLHQCSSETSVGVFLSAGKMPQGQKGLGPMNVTMQPREDPLCCCGDIGQAKWLQGLTSPGERTRGLQLPPSI